MNRHTRLVVIFSVAALIGTVFIGIGIYSVVHKSNSQPTIQIDNTQTNKIRVRVPADQMWYDTGIDVTGKFIQIQYESGMWRNAPGAPLCDGEGKVGYEDTKKLILPSGNLSALIGKVGNKIFFVGNFYDGKPGDGELYLSLNDKEGYFYDNSGALYMNISMIPETISSAFNVALTPEHFPSTLDLIGAYEITIPGDKKWYDTGITVNPNTQLQMGFMQGTQGNVTIQVGDYSQAFNEALPENTFYEFDFVTFPPYNNFYHPLNHPAALKVRSSTNNVYLRVEVRKVRLKS